LDVGTLGIHGQDRSIQGDRIWRERLGASARAAGSRGTASRGVERNDLITKAREKASKMLVDLGEGHRISDGLSSRVARPAAQPVEIARKRTAAKFPQQRGGEVDGPKLANGNPLCEVEITGTGITRVVRLHTSMMSASPQHDAGDGAGAWRRRPGSARRCMKACV